MARQPLDHPWRNGFPAREPDGSVYYGPACLCGSRNQAKIGKLLWRCVPCGRVNEYRVTGEGFLPFTREVARLMDEERATR